MRPHYHVFDTQLGCLPTVPGGDIFAKRAEAAAFIRSLAADYRESGYKVAGNTTAGYDIAPTGRLYIEPCAACECEEDLDG